MRIEKLQEEDEGVFKMKRVKDMLKSMKEGSEQPNTKSDVEIKYSIEELLSFYMKQSKQLIEELAQVKAELKAATEKIEEKELEVQRLNKKLEDTEEKAVKLAEENVRLTAIEKVWKETFAKITFVGSDLAKEGDNVDELTDLERQEIEEEVNGSYDFADIDYDCEIDYEV